MKFSIIIDKIKQYPVAVVSAVLIIVLAVVIFLRGDIATDLAVKESDLNSRIRTIEQNVKNANNIGQDTEDLAVIVEKIKSLLFDRYERAINISFFYEFEDKADVVISNISQLPQPDPIYAEGGTRKLSGTFKNVLKFLYELNRADPLIRVADFQVSREGDGMGGKNVNARLRVLVLAKKE